MRAEVLVEVVANAVADQNRCGENRGQRGVLADHPREALFFWRHPDLLSVNAERVSSVAAHATDAGQRRDGCAFAFFGRRLVTAHAVALNSRHGAIGVLTMAVDAVGGADVILEVRLGVLAGIVVLLLLWVAVAAHRRDFVGRGHAVGRNGAGGGAMFLRRAVADAALELLGVLVGGEVGDLIVVAGCSVLVFRRRLREGRRDPDPHVG